MMKLYLHFPTHLHSVLLNYLTPGIILPHYNVYLHHGFQWMQKVEVIFSTHTKSHNGVPGSVMPPSQNWQNDNVSTTMARFLLKLNLNFITEWLNEYFISSITVQILGWHFDSFFLCPGISLKLLFLFYRTCLLYLSILIIYTILLLQLIISYLNLFFFTPVFSYHSLLFLFILNHIYSYSYHCSFSCILLSFWCQFLHWFS
jgi:hypothetical protein